MKNLYKIKDELYIVSSSEKIKENTQSFKQGLNGDWFYNTIYNFIVRTGDITSYDFKIILTTNKLLIKDGVQAIDDEFLEWFVKNPSCEEVGVKLKQHFQADKLKRENPLNGVYHSYKIIIPKEEPTMITDWLDKHGDPEIYKKVEREAILKYGEPKQETLEEAANKIYPNDEYYNEYYCDMGELHREKFIEGAKWQQERMYSEEDMAESFMACWKANVPEGFECKLSFNEWFEQFKKK